MSTQRIKRECMETFSHQPHQAMFKRPTTCQREQKKTSLFDKIHSAQVRIIKAEPKPRSFTLPLLNKNLTLFDKIHSTQARAIKAEPKHCPKP